MESRNSADTLPKVAVLIPEEMRARIFPEVVEDALRSFALPSIATDTELASGQFETDLCGVTAVITGWKSPKLPPHSLAPEGNVAFVSHAAGSVKLLGVHDALEAGHIRVSHAAPAIAQAVAEFTIAQILTHLRRLREFDAAVRASAPWFETRDRYLGQLLGAQDVGIVGLGYVGRSVLNLLRPFGCNVFIFDPFISHEQATKLGVKSLGLNELFEQCGVVSLHAANLPETEGMISRVHLESLRPESLLVNSARAGLIEKGALYEVLRQGKIFAAIDNFDTEPLPEDDPVRHFTNVYLSPHHAGHTRESYVRQGLSAVEEVRRFLLGQELKQEIPRERAHTLA